MSEPYDAHARRDTPLALKLKARIRAEGPLYAAAYFDACLNDPEFGYYRTQAAIGARGDFITAPEISQVFGELIGLWCAVVWQQMGKPEVFEIIEFGAGRGTMLRDALRAARIVPAFVAAARLTIVEINPRLIERQKEALADAGVPVAWGHSLGNVRQTRGIAKVRHPGVVLGNEYLDTIVPVTAEYRDGRWYERVVEIDARDRLQFAISRKRETPPRKTPYLVPRDGDVFVEAIQPVDIIDTFMLHLDRARAAALLIDYGHTQRIYGDTVQAVRAHRFEHPLTSPGEADLSAQVDFEAVTDNLNIGSWTTDGPVTQAEFLGSLGIMERASRLMAANPSKANEIETGVARLMAPNGMGTRFKVLGVRSKGLPPLPGFPTNAAR